MPIPVDGALSFAYYYLSELSKFDDWRTKYLMDTLTKEVENMPLPNNICGSYLLSATRKRSKIFVTTPYGNIVEIELHGSFAEPIGVIKGNTGHRVPVRLLLSRRSDIKKALMVKESLNTSLSGRVGIIDPRRGGYKDISLEIQIKYTNLLFVALVRSLNLDTLKNLLDILIRFGVGKKRNMGWGDIKDYKVYRVHKGDKNNVILINDKQIQYLMDNLELAEILRPFSRSNFAKKFEIGKNNGWKIEDLKLGQGSEKPPYWRKQLVILFAKLVKSVKNK